MPQTDKKILLQPASIGGKANHMSYTVNSFVSLIHSKLVVPLPQMPQTDKKTAATSLYWGESERD
jgi:hypothetical protein